MNAVELSRDTRRCIVCGHEKAEAHFDGLLKCSTCGFIFADVTLTDEQLYELYRRNYFFGEEYADYLRDQDALRKNFALRFKVLERFIDPKRHKNLVEIGSAYGFFLDLVRDRFETVRGIDITEDGVRHARDVLDLDVRLGDFATAEMGDLPMDVVCLWDTVEHVGRPDVYLKKAAQNMGSGALLALTTGDISSLNARIQGKSWRLIHPPTHLYYFSKDTISRLLDECGFDIVYCKYAGFFRSVDNVAYIILVLQKRAPWLYEWVKRSGLGRLNFYLNLFDIMYVIARRR